MRLRLWRTKPTSRPDFRIYETRDERCAKYRDAIGAATCLQPGCGRCWHGEPARPLELDRLQEQPQEQPQEPAGRYIARHSAEQPQEPQEPAQPAAAGPCDAAGSCQMTAGCRHFIRCRPEWDAIAAAGPQPVEELEQLRESEERARAAWARFLEQRARVTRLLEPLEQAA